MTLIKAEQAEEGLAKIGGVISTETRDLQGEIVIQDGLDFSDFERSGYFNYEHRPGIENLLGYPTKIIRKGSQTVVEGVLMLDRPKAREVYETAQAMAKSRGLRSLGFSVEGHVTERDENDPKIVKKALVRHCAITSSPINPQTSMELRKSSRSFIRARSATKSPRWAGEHWRRLSLSSSRRGPLTRGLWSQTSDSPKRSGRYQFNFQRCPSQI